MSHQISQNEESIECMALKVLLRRFLGTSTEHHRGSSQPLRKRPHDDATASQLTRSALLELDVGLVHLGVAVQVYGPTKKKNKLCWGKKKR